MAQRVFPPRFESILCANNPNRYDHQLETTLHKRYCFRSPFIPVSKYKYLVIFMDHTIVHFEIPADDIEKLKKFYQDLFGWKLETYPGPTVYYMIQTVPVDEKTMMPIRPGVNGGLYSRKDAQKPQEAKQTNYISVESVNEYSKKIEELGGTIKIPKMEIPGIGWWALAIDPEGNNFGLLEYKKK
jgi:predicted enzyme related to lactoylglutathione lyase